MKKVIIGGAFIIALAILAIGVIGCGGGAPVKAKTISPQVSGDTVSISATDVQSNKNVRFGLRTDNGVVTYMAYTLGGEIQVRANVCPPCRSIGFSLDKSVLVCDRCATRFEAQTGKGIDGACVNYPKAAVPYEISGGNIVMKADDLISAYLDTIEPGLP